MQTRLFRRICWTNRLKTEIGSSAGTIFSCRQTQAGVSNEAKLASGSASYLISTTSCLLSSYFLFHSSTSFSFVTIWGGWKQRFKTKTNNNKKKQLMSPLFAVPPRVRCPVSGPDLWVGVDSLRRCSWWAWCTASSWTLRCRWVRTSPCAASRNERRGGREKETSSKLDGGHTRTNVGAHSAAREWLRPPPF